MAFHGLIAHFFSALNILLSGCMYHRLFIPPPAKGHLGYFQILAMTNKAALYKHLVQVFERHFL